MARWQGAQHPGRRRNCRHVPAAELPLRRPREQRHDGKGHIILAMGGVVVAHWQRSSGRAVIEGLIHGGPLRDQRCCRRRGRQPPPTNSTICAKYAEIAQELVIKLYPTMQDLI